MAEEFRVRKQRKRPAQVSKEPFEKELGYRLRRRETMTYKDSSQEFMSLVCKIKELEHFDRLPRKDTLDSLSSNNVRRIEQILSSQW